MTYTVSQKLNQFRSVTHYFKAVTYNKGIAWVNRIIYGSDVLRSGQVVFSPGGTFQYKVLGPCCRLFDREDLPWPSCSLQWKGKQPSWRRIGKRLVPDVATRKSPSYSVQMISQDTLLPAQVITLYWSKHNPTQQDWWCPAKRRIEKFQVVTASRPTSSVLQIFPTRLAEVG